MEYLYDELKDYCNDSMIENIRSNYGKIIGVEYEDDLKENNKLIGRILLKRDAPKFELGDYVEFSEKHIKWRGNGFCLVNPHWCKEWQANEKIRVPVDVYKPKENKIVTEHQRMNYKQFVTRRMLDYTRNWPTILTKAIDNWKALRYKGNYYAINATVKNYCIKQDVLESALGKINRHMATINREWDKLYKLNTQQDRKAERIAKLKLKKFQEERPKKVIKMKKTRMIP